MGNSSEMDMVCDGKGQRAIVIAIIKKTLITHTLCTPPNI